MRLQEASKILNYDKGKRAIDQKSKLTKVEVDPGDDGWNGDIEEPKRSKYLIYLTLGTFIFFVTAIATAYFVRYAGIDRTISTGKISIIVQGATVVNSGSTVPLAMRIANRNPVSIEGAKLYITYPTGTFIKNEEGIAVPARRDEVFFGVIESGEILNHAFTPILFGRSGEAKEVQYELEYDIAGVAQSQKIRDVYEVLLRESPVLISRPKYTNPVAGKEMKFTFEIQSNAPEDLPATYVDVSYPNGFTPNRNGFDPVPSNVDGTRWEIIGLKPGVKKTINVTGTIRSSEGESQGVAVRAFVSPSGKQTEAVEVASEEDVLIVGKAFLSVDMLLNDRLEDYIVVDPGAEVEGVIRWKNQDSAKLENIAITATITGTGIDETSVRVGDGGSFDEIRKQMVWDRESTRSLLVAGAGKTGELSFTFETLPDRIEFAQEQKYVQIVVSAQAERSETRAVESVRDVSVGQVRLRSVLQVVGNTLFGSSELQNSGPLPPQVGRETTFVLKYFVKNSGNRMADFKMVIPLGLRVEMTGEVSGIASSEWEYDEENRSVQVHLPLLAAGGPQSSRSIEFQVSVEPRREDVGRYLALTQGSTYNAYDTFVNESVRERFGQLTTQITAEKTDDTRIIEYQQRVPDDEKLEGGVRAPQMPDVDPVAPTF